MQTQVAVIGGGPAGLLLSQILHLNGIDNIVLERRSREYVLSRIRAGVLESGTVSMLERAKVADRMHKESDTHSGFVIAFRGETVRIGLEELTNGKVVTIYGQTEITRDLYEAREAMGGIVIDEADNVQLHGLDTDKPTVTFDKNDESQTVQCDFVAGCDGFHGVSRTMIPADIVKTFELVYPFGWLGVLSKTPPVSHEVIYVAHERGFALCSMRSETLSRYYLQCPVDDDLVDWSDDRFWTEFKSRLPTDVAERLITGPSIEKSIAPLRSFVCEPMAWKRLFLAGDAGHIVPPTGAKGLNLASSDVHYLSRAFINFYKDGDTDGLDNYSAIALQRVWKAERFSWWMTKFLNDFPDSSEFDNRMRQADFDYLKSSPVAQKSLAENYVGVPY